MLPRDVRILEHILDYCDDVQDTLDLIEGSFDRFALD